MAVPPEASPLLVSNMLLSEHEPYHTQTWMQIVLQCQESAGTPYRDSSWIFLETVLPPIFSTFAIDHGQYSIPQFDDPGWQNVSNRDREPPPWLDKLLFSANPCWLNRHDILRTYPNQKSCQNVFYLPTKIKKYGMDHSRPYYTVILCNLHTRTHIYFTGYINKERNFWKKAHCKQRNGLEKLKKVKRTNKR